MVAPNLKLVCPIDYWAPEDALALGVVTAHMETEHDLTDEVDLVLQAFCPRDNTRFEEDEGVATYRQTVVEILHVCPACKRTYIVKMKR